MIHGYQGSDYDLEKCRNWMHLHNRSCHGLLIKNMVDTEESSIEDMGKAVAEEVKVHFGNTSNRYKKLNFLGFSLGGVIAR